MAYFYFLYYLVITYLCVLCIYYVEHRWRRRKWYSWPKNVTGPYSLPFIGAAYLLLIEPSNPLRVIMEKVASYSDVSKFWMGNKVLYFLKNPNHIEKVISNPKSLDKDYFYEPLALVTGEGLVTSGGTKWRRHRKLISPSFNQKTLDSFVELFNAISEPLVKELQNTVGQKDVPLYSIIGKYTVELTCQTAMGVEMNVQSIEGSVGEVLGTLVDLYTEKLMKLWNHVDIIWYLSGKKSIFQNHINRLRSIVTEIINKKMENVESKVQEIGVTNIDGDIPKRRAFLDNLMTNTDLDENEIRDEVNTFIVAATETTSNTLTALLTILGIYPDIQEQVYKEIIEVIGIDGEVLPEDLNRLVFTERVIKETLRLFPAGPIMTRYVSGDIDIGDNIVLPEGASVAIPLVYIHRCGEYWEDPLKFDPDRFLPENVAKRHPLTYFGFSQGLRSCIGSKYAMMNMKVMLAFVVRRLKFFSEYKSVEEIELKMTMLLKMMNGPKVWIEKR